MKRLIVKICVFLFNALVTVAGIILMNVPLPQTSVNLYELGYALANMFGIYSLISCVSCALDIDE